MRLILAIFILMVACVAGHAQILKKKKKNPPDVETSPSSVNPNPTQSYGPKKSHGKKTAGPTYDSDREYYERMEELVKTRRKNERMMEKPQYSDPLYFGHKRPPKKRPPSKMKFCKVCGIRH